MGSRRSNTCKTSNRIESQLVQFLPGVGPALAKEFARIGVHTVKDLLLHFPIRYEDRREFTPLNRVQPGNYYQVRGKVLTVRYRPAWRRSISIIQAIIQDESSALALIWFNQDYLKELLQQGEEFIFYGKVERDQVYGLQMLSPELTPVNNLDELSFGRIVPIYSLGSAKRLTQRRMRKIVWNALVSFSNQIEDPLSELPYPELKGFLPLSEAIWEIHFPSSNEQLKQAKDRIVFEEFFFFSLQIEQNKRKVRTGRRRSYNLTHNLVLDYFVSRLPFNFTEAQNSAINQMLSDFKENRVLNCLLQGDVGSGKTVVALYLAALVVGSGYQVAFMVPTEILAQQHFSRTLPLFPEDTVALLTGSTKKRDRQRLLRRLKEGEPLLVFGTHSLIQSDVEFAKLGLAIIDEQHRFGVRQRMDLARKCPEVDLLVMTATPIPRSLAMTLYGDLDLVVIDSLPPGRKPVKTVWITSDKRDRLYKFLREKVKEGRQVYVVYPLVSESDTVDLLAAEEMYERMKKEIFPDLSLGLIHGKLPPQEKEAVMKRFYEGQIDILVATVVIEVGIDVPNATVMVIEHAERFGLSQLHQLRGRIGRGEHESYCVVVSDTESETTKKRLGAFIKYTDGFRLSEVDLILRGPGEFKGERQHGPTEFKVGNPITDFEILTRAKRCAVKVYPMLEKGKGKIWSFLMS